MSRSGLRKSRAPIEITIATHSLADKMKDQELDVSGRRKRLRSLWREIYTQASMAAFLFFSVPFCVLGQGKPKATGFRGSIQRFCLKQKTP